MSQITNRPPPALAMPAARTVDVGMASERLRTFRMPSGNSAYSAPSITSTSPIAAHRSFNCKRPPYSAGVAASVPKNWKNWLFGESTIVVSSADNAFSYACIER